MRRLAVAALSVAIWTACGPSLRQLHRGDVYYERCRSADHDERVPTDERRACWQAWVREWSNGQPASRVGYAREQILRSRAEQAEIVALATGESGGDASSSEQTDSASGDAAAQTESADAATGSVLEADAGAQPSEQVFDAEERAPIAPAAERRARRRVVMPATLTPLCARRCEPAWAACTGACEGGARSACIIACRIELRTCARSCF